MEFQLGLQNKTVVVTGGSSGIGFATALAFARQGANVSICARSADKLSLACEKARDQGLNLYAESLDVCDSDSLYTFGDHVCGKFGSLDVWINNAGMSMKKNIFAITDAEWDEAIAINLTAVFRGSRYAAMKMIEFDHGGVIMNASSFQALIPSAGSLPYGATKSAVINLSSTLAGELAAYNIRVLSYVPGVINTEMSSNWMNGESQLQNIPMGRYGNPEDIANVLIFLASDKAEYMNGVHVDITGGKFCVQNPRFSYGNY